MSDVVDLLSATSDGVFALLDAAIGSDAVEVTTETPQLEPGDTTERQFVLIGDIDVGNDGGKGEQAERITVQVVVIYRGTQRSKLHALMHQVRVALEDQVPAIAGVQFGSIDWAGGASSPSARDGITYAGIQEFEVNAEPA
jgi:hypothetical protein